MSTYEALLKFSPPALDLLLPHANWSSPPPGAGYADWLISVFERWYTAPRQETRIRLFSELIQLILGHPGEVEGLGLLPSTLIVVDTDGSIKQLDSLSSAYPGAADTGLESCRAASTTPWTTRRRWPGRSALTRSLRSACLPGHGDLRRRPVPAPVPGRATASGTPPSTARICSGSSRTCATGWSRTCRLADLPPPGLTGRTARFPRSAGSAAPPPAPRDAPG